METFGYFYSHYNIIVFILIYNFEDKSVFKWRRKKFNQLKIN